MTDNQATTKAAALRPGTRVRLTRPESPNHFRAGQTGVVREACVYQGPPPRVWLVVEFPDCPHNGSLPFASYLWGSEIDVAGL